MRKGRGKKSLGNKSSQEIRIWMLFNMANDEVDLVNLSLEHDARPTCLLMVLHSSTVLWGHTEGLTVIFINDRKDAVLGILCG